MVKDLSSLPAIITITNNYTEETLPKFYDAGSLQKAKAADIKVDDKDNKYVLGTGDITVQFYRINTFITIKAGDSVKIAAETSEEVSYFESLATDMLSVEVASSTETTPEDTNTEAETTPEDTNTEAGTTDNDTPTDNSGGQE